MLVASGRPRGAVGVPFFRQVSEAASRALRRTWFRHAHHRASRPTSQNSAPGPEEYCGGNARQCLPVADVAERAVHPGVEGADIAFFSTFSWAVRAQSILKPKNEFTTVASGFRARVRSRAVPASSSAAIGRDAAPTPVDAADLDR